MIDEVILNRNKNINRISLLLKKLIMVNGIKVMNKNIIFNPFNHTTPKAYIQSFSLNT